MAATAPPVITALPAPPDPNDRSTFNARAYPWSVAQQTLATEVGAVAANVYANAEEATAAAEIAVPAAAAAAAVANYKGPWAGLVGALAIPASVTHSSKVWMLTESVANVAAEVPGISLKWLNLSPVTPPTPTPPGLTLLSTVTASNSATVDLETTFNGTYDDYMIVFSSAKPSVSAAQFLCRLKIGGSYQATAYSYHVGYPNVLAPSYGSSAYTSVDGIYLSPLSGVVTPGGHLDMVMHLHDAASATRRPGVHFSGLLSGPAGGASPTAVINGAGQHNTADAAITGVRLMFNTGNITSGKFRLYGIRKT